MLRGCDLIPWLFAGPLLVAIFSNIAYQITRIDWIAHVAMVTTCLAVLALVAAAWPSLALILRSRKKRDASSDRGTPSPGPGCEQEALSARAALPVAAREIEP